MSTNRIVEDFVHIAASRPGVAATREVLGSRKIKNVFDLNGLIGCLLYVKSRSEHPLRWGVTANVLEGLKSQEKPWAVLLLYGSPQTGYLIPSRDVEEYIRQNVWPFGQDGDFKVSPGSPLANTIPFQTIGQLFDELSSLYGQA